MFKGSKYNYLLEQLYLTNELIKRKYTLVACNLHYSEVMLVAYIILFCKTIGHKSLHL